MNFLIMVQRIELNEYYKYIRMELSISLRNEQTIDQVVQLIMKTELKLY